MNTIDFATLYLISVPGFLVGLMTGRFLEGSRWQSLRRSLGMIGKLVSAAGWLALFGTSLITLGVMLVYLANLPAAAGRSNFWITLLVAFWIVLNLFFAFRDLATGQRRK